MDCIAIADADREAELIALARLVIYGRDAAKALNSGELEYCLASALEAIIRELGDDDEQLRAPQKRGVQNSSSFQ